MNVEDAARWLLSLDRPQPRQRMLDEFTPEERAAILAAERVVLAASDVEVPHLEAYKGQKTKSQKDELRELRARVGHLEKFLTKQNSSLHTIEGVLRTKQRDSELFDGVSPRVQRYHDMSRRNSAADPSQPDVPLAVSIDRLSPHPPPGDLPTPSPNPHVTLI